MTAAGFTLAGAGHPIIPVMLGDASLAQAMAEKMLERGIYVIGFSFPVVPKGQARIRTQMSAAHSSADVDRCVVACRPLRSSSPPGRGRGVTRSVTEWGCFQITFRKETFYVQHDARPR